MPEPIDGQDFAGPHPTCREFVAQLLAWGFTQRGEQGVQTVFRGPHGGTLRVIRSQLGRADAALVDKAARLADVTPAQFWSGPEPHATSASLPDTARAAGTPSRRKRAAHDSIVSLVLAIHAQADRPLGFDQVVELSGNRVTREQVSTASSALCRDRQLDRIRSGVYQWSAGQRALARQIPAPRRPAEPHPQQALMPATPAAPPARHISGAELFTQLFPHGVQMTSELFADLEQLIRLTSKLTARGNDSAQQGGRGTGVTAQVSGATGLEVALCDGLLTTIQLKSRVPPLLTKMGRGPGSLTRELAMTSLNYRPGNR